MTDLDTVRLHYQLDGPPTAPLLVLGSSIGTDLHLWEPNIRGLSTDFRVLRFDTRGHGGSPVPAGPYGIDGLAADVLAVVDEVGANRFAYCGVSIGGAIGQQLALERPDRLNALVLCSTAARFGEAEGWHERAARVRAEGTEWLVEASRRRWFAAPDRPYAERILGMLRTTPAEGYAGCCEALAGFDAHDRLHEIRVPTLVVAGADDPATPPTTAEVLADGIPCADLLVLAHAAHLATAERPTAANEAILDFLRKATR